MMRERLEIEFFFQLKNAISSNIQFSCQTVKGYFLSINIDNINFMKFL